MWPLAAHGFHKIRVPTFLGGFCEHEAPLSCMWQCFMFTPCRVLWYLVVGVVSGFESPAMHLILHVGCGLGWGVKLWYHGAQEKFKHVCDVRNELVQLQSGAYGFFTEGPGRQLALHAWPTAVHCCSRTHSSLHIHTPIHVHSCCTVELK